MKNYEIDEFQKSKKTIRKYIFSAVFSLLMIGGFTAPAYAAFDTYGTSNPNSPVVSSNANPNACFGQARASYAKGGPNGALAPHNNGYYISLRKGNNPANNDWYRDTYCSSTNNNKNN